ncbi:hypothetical protein PRIPAC_88756, partial [Pristionchus pacificus]|uniref:Uncharacterized protein n=1 Tax=Pristionchus pacificus TaxID=54126 RepID=A0A2A6CVV0_PRIPA
DVSSNFRSTAIALSVEFVAEKLGIALVDEKLSSFASFQCNGLVADYIALESGLTRSQVKLKTLVAEEIIPNASANGFIEIRNQQASNMFDLTFVQCKETGYKLNVASMPLTVYFNPKFLGTLQKFFAVESVEQLEKDKITSLTGFTSGKTVANTQPSSMILHVSMKEIELVIIESSTVCSSQSLILSFDIEAHPENGSPTILAGINNLVMYTAAKPEISVLIPNEEMSYTELASVNVLDTLDISLMIEGAM